MGNIACLCVNNERNIDFDTEKSKEICKIIFNRRIIYYQ